MCARAERGFPCAANEGNTASIECVALGRRPLATETQTAVERWRVDGEKKIKNTTHDAQTLTRFRPFYANLCAPKQLKTESLVYFTRHLVVVKEESVFQE